MRSFYYLHGAGRQRRGTRKQGFSLHKKLVALVHFAEFLGRTAFVFLEYAVEVRHVVESRTEAYVGDRSACADQIA